MRCTSNSKGTLLTIALAAAFLMGCQKTESQSDQASPPGENGAAANDSGESSGLSIKAPGVDVEVDPEEGVRVDAPGDVEVKVDKDGVSVDAPETNVDVKKTP